MTYRVHIREGKPVVVDQSGAKVADSRVIEIHCDSAKDAGLTGSESRITRISATIGVGTRMFTNVSVG